MTKKTEAPKTARQKLIDRVCKLLAKADSTDHTPEAEAFRAKAIELMAKNNISAAEAVQKDNAAFETLSRTQTTVEMQRFDRTLINAIAWFNGCGFVYTQGFGKIKAVATFCGRPADIEATEYMVHIVFQQRKAAYDKYSETYIARFGKEQWRDDETDWRRWMNGYSTGVYSKLKSLVDAADVKTQEWGLVPVDVQKLTLTWYDENIEKTRTNKAPMKTGSKAGFEAGKSVSIHKGLEGGTGDTKLIG